MKPDPRVQAPSDSCPSTKHPFVPIGAVEAGRGKEAEPMGISNPSKNTFSAPPVALQLTST